VTMGTEAVASIVNALGRRIYVDADDERGRRMVATDGNVNPHSIELWRTALSLRPWRLVVDVGCNYGEMLADVDLPPGAEVVAFEPSPSVLPHLRRTLAELPFEVELRELAVSDAPGEAQFVMDLGWSGTSALADAHAVQTEQVEMVLVPVTTIDEALSGREVRDLCMKIDVEGHDLRVLSAARGSIRRADAAAIMIEVLHFSPLVIADLAAEWEMYLMDGRSGALVRVPPGDGDAVAAMLASGWVLPQDALLLQGDVQPEGMAA